MFFSSILRCLLPEDTLAAIATTKYYKEKEMDYEKERGEKYLKLNYIVSISTIRFISSHLNELEKF